MNYIFCIPEQELSFNNSNHLENFVKYLYSKSKSHVLNENTIYNFYQRKQDTQIKQGFLTNADTKYENFVSNINIQEYRNYKCDAFNIYFIININNKIVTNLFNLKDETISLLLDDSMIDYIDEVYIQDLQNGLLSRMESVCDDAIHNDIPIINFYDLTKSLELEELKQIEVLLHKQLRASFRDDTVILQISHNDQLERPYHIHRLKKVK